MTLRIRELRTASGLSQQALADMAGLSRSQLSEIENEAKPVNTRRLNAIAAALQVPVDELFDQSAKDAYLEEVRALWPLMTDDDRQAVVRMIRAFAGR